MASGHQQSLSEGREGDEELTQEPKINGQVATNVLLLLHLHQSHCYSTQQQFGSEAIQSIGKQWPLPELCVSSRTPWPLKLSCALSLSLSL